jgi:hypothetical protein
LFGLRAGILVMPASFCIGSEARVRTSPSSRTTSRAVPYHRRRTVNNSREDAKQHKADAKGWSSKPSSSRLRVFARINRKSADDRCLSTPPRHRSGWRGQDGRVLPRRNGLAHPKSAGEPVRGQAPGHPRPFIIQPLRGAVGLWPQSQLHSFCPQPDTSWHSACTISPTVASAARARDPSQTNKPRSGRDRLRLPFAVDGCKSEGPLQDVGARPWR